MECRAVTFPVHGNAADAFTLLGFFQRIKGDHQRGSAPGGGGPVGHLGIVIDQPVEGALHDGEGRRGLHHLAQRHGAIEELRCAKNDRQYRCDIARGLRHNSGLHVLDGDRAPGGNHLPEGAVQTGALFLLTSDQGNALAVVAEARNCVTIFRLRLVFVFGDLYEFAADQHHGAAGGQRVYQRGDHEEPGNVQLNAG